MSKTYQSIFGDEQVQDLGGFLADVRRENVELFSTSRIDLIRSNMWKCHAPWYVTRRTLMNDYILVVFDGALQVESPHGTKVLTRGEFFLSAPGEYHEFGFTGTLDYVEHLLIHFRINFPHHPFRRNLFSSPFLRLPSDEGWFNKLKTLAYLWGERSNASKGYAETLLRNLFIDLCVNSDTLVSPHVPLDARVAEGIHFIRDHFQREISIADVARKTGLSEAQFRKLFREQTQRSPLDFLTETRLQHASVLLQNSMMKIGEIAKQSGFNSVDYFCRSFKKNYRRTPSEHRRGDMSF